LKKLKMIYYPIFHGLRLFGFLALTCLMGVACQGHLAQKYERRELSEYYVSSGITQYFLADLPVWANFSETGQCQRDISIRYLNFTRLRQSFSLSYEEAVQIQYMLNQAFEDLKRKTKSNYLLLKDEENLFHEVFDKVQSGIKAFYAPEFASVNLLWIDEALKDAEKMKKLKRQLPQLMNQRPTIFVSLCLSHFGLNAFLQKHGLQNFGIQAITFEMFNPYDLQGEASSKFSLDFDQVFRHGQKLFLYLPQASDKKKQGKPIPKEFIGTFEILRF